MRSFRLLMLFMLLPLLTSCNGQLFATPTLTSTPTLTPTPAPTATPTPQYAAIPKLYLGAFNAGTDMEESLGHKFTGQLYYHRWGMPFGEQLFIDNANKGWITMPTWEYMPSFDVDNPNILKPLQAILNGEFDDYIHEFAQDAAAFKKPLFMRWGHEMNGDWYPWSGKRNGGAVADKYGDPQKADGPERFADTFRYIHKIFDEEKATNVVWVWCPNVAMTGPLGEPWNHINNYYPGDEYVDWLCVDGYNWGTSQNWSSWQSFDQIYQTTYQQLQAINARKPMMIGEFSSTEKGGDKAAWITDTFQRIPDAYPQLRMIFWFNINKETDWRINSSDASLESFKKAISAPAWDATPWPGILP